MKFYLILFILVSINSFAQKKPTPFFNKGDSLAGKKQYADAVWYYSRSIIANEDNQDIYYARAMAQFELSDYSAAIDDFNTYLDIVKGKEYDRKMDYRGFTSTQVAISNAYLGFIYLNKGDKDYACKCFTKAGQYGYSDIYATIKRECK